MNNKIVGVLKPFELNQYLYIFQDGVKVGEISSSIKDISNTILSLAKEYNISSVDLTGPRQFSLGIKNDIKKEQISKNDNFNIEINII